MKVYHRLNNIKATKNFQNLCQKIDPENTIQPIKNKLIRISKELKYKIQENDVNRRNYVTKTANLAYLDEFIDNQDEKFFSLFEECNKLIIQDSKDDQQKLFDIIK